jgi:hypothetical protein
MESGEWAKQAWAGEVAVKGDVARSHTCTVFGRLTAVPLGTNSHKGELGLLSVFRTSALFS